MSKACMGAMVQYCGHNACFIADIYVVGNTNVVRANGPIKLDKIIRPAQGVTHHLSDFPSAGFWKPELGVFVVPQEQVKEINEEDK